MKRNLLFVYVITAAILVVQIASGATPTYRYQDDVTTLRGDAIGGATVTVYEAGTTTLATLYTGVSTAYSTKSNPTYTDVYGRFFFYLTPGIYDITITGTGITSYTIEDVQISDYQDYSDAFYVTAYGAVGDSTTDDTAEIQAAIDAAIDERMGRVVIPPGVYYVTSTITVARDSAQETDTQNRFSIDMDGATIIAPATLDFPILKIGADGYRTRNITINGGTIKFQDRNWDYTSEDSSAVCIDMLNVMNCNINSMRVFNGWAGLRLRANGSEGSVYNVISDVYANECLNAFQISREDATAWVNENSFYSGGCHYNSTGDDASSGYALSLIVDAESGNTVNNNKFFGMSLEQGRSSNKPGGIYDQYGNYNSYISCRYEGFDVPYADFGPSSNYNYIIGGYATYASNVVAEEDWNRVSIISGRTMAIAGGSADTPAIYANNKSTGNGPVYVARNANNNEDVFTIFGNGAINFNPTSTAPTDSTRGTIYYYSDDDIFMVFDGSTWKPLGSLSWDGHTALADTAWTDVLIPASSFKVPTSNAPTAVKWGTSYTETYSFDEGEYMIFDGLQLPHGYIPGTDLHFHVHMAPDNSVAIGDTLRMQLEYRIGAIGDEFSAAVLDTLEYVAPSLIAADTHIILGGVTIDGTDLDYSSIMIGAIRMIAGTTYINELLFLSADARVAINRLGTANPESD